MTTPQTLKPADQLPQKLQPAKGASDCFGQFMGMGAAIGASLYGGIENTIQAANTMSQQAAAALAKFLENTAIYLEFIAKDQLSEQQKFIDQIDTDQADMQGASGKTLSNLQLDVQTQTTELNDLNNEYDQTKSTETTQRDQLTTQQSNLNQDISNLLENLKNYVQMILLRF